MSLKQEKTKNKNELKLTFTVEAEKFEKAIQEVFKESAKYFNIPGFRKGKAPYNIVKKHYGANIFYEDAFNKIVPEVFEEEIKKNKIDMVGKADNIDVVQMEEGKELIFTAIISTRPEFELGKYKGIELKKIEYKVTDKEIDEEIKHTAEHNARKIRVEDRALKKNDIANIDYEGSVDGVPFEGGKAEKYDLTIGSNTFIPGFEDQLIGMKIGEEKDINVKFPEEYHAENLKGKDAIFKVKLNSISFMEIPVIDDEFAKDVSEFDTLKEYKASIKEEKEHQNKHKAEHEMEDLAIEEVMKNTKIDIPNSMIELEIDNMEENINQRLTYQGLSLAKYAEMLGKTKEDIRKEFQVEAEKNVKTRLVLNKIIETEKIKVEAKEIKSKLEEMAKQYGSKVEDLDKNEEIKKYMEETIKAEKAIKFILDNAKIK